MAWYKMTMSYHIHVLCSYTTHAHAHARTFACMRALSCHQGNITYFAIHRTTKWAMVNVLLVVCCNAVVCCSAVMVNVLLTQHSSMSHIHTHTIWVVCSLQHTEAHCNTLQHTATCCYTLQYTATICTKLQHAQTEPGYSAHCNTLQHTATNWNTLQHPASPYNTPGPSAHRRRPEFLALTSNAPMLHQEFFLSPARRNPGHQLHAYVQTNRHTYIYIYMYVCTYIYVHLYIYTYVHIYIYIYISVYITKYINILICIYMCIYK